MTLLWSADSKWCAFYYAQPRVGYTGVFRLSGSEFKAVNRPEELVATNKGDVRNEYIKPTKWLKPGSFSWSSTPLCAEATERATSSFS